MANEENLKMFEPGISGNPNGRPKKYISTLKADGYKLSEVNDTIQTMMSMSYDEVRAVYNDKQSTVLEKTIAAAIKKSIEKGTLESMETLLNRVYGLPKQKMGFEGEISHAIKVDIVPPPIDDL